VASACPGIFVLNLRSALFRCLAKPLLSLFHEDKSSDTNTNEGTDCPTYDSKRVV
jgi:hypothetical protein